jgi:hypothetical protein
MGVNINETEMDKIDLLKDLELARANLSEKLNDEGAEQYNDPLNHLPLEEMKYIEWKSHSSDEEEFRVVVSRKSKKKERRKQKQIARAAKGKIAQPLDGSSTFDGGISRASSKYNLRKGAAWTKVC